MTDEEERAQYDELCAYTLSRGDPAFVHQLVVDAWAAQHATPESKPISPVFALTGLYLHLEYGYTGRQVQLAHMKLAKQRKQWPRLTPPADRGRITVSEPFHAQGDAAHDEAAVDQAIDRWCASVWESWKDSQESIRQLVQNELKVESRKRP